jgi:hypothetical protein
MFASRLKKLFGLFSAAAYNEVLRSGFFKLRGLKKPMQGRIGRSVVQEAQTSGLSIKRMPLEWNDPDGNLF